MLFLKKVKNKPYNLIMRQILIIGSGKSSAYLIKYLLDKSISENLFVTVADIHITTTIKQIGNHKNFKAIT